jgi:hypothetical protein
LTIKRLKIPDDVHKYLYYDASSQTCVRWKVGGRLKGKGAEIVIANDRAGGININRGCQITFDGISYAISAVIYKLVHKKDIPDGFVIDHINGNPLDNRVENLRIVDYTTNSRNCKKKSDNSSGWNGIHWSTKTGRFGQHMLYCCATWYDLAGKNKRKYFRVDYLGITRALTEAIRFRRNMIEKLNSLGAGYTDRHGS